MSEDGRELKQLTDFDERAVNPDWSPDGSRIAFATGRGEPRGYKKLWVVNTDGTNAQPLVNNPQVEKAQFGEHPAWSPDGNKIAFDWCLDCELGGSNREIFIADLTTGSIDTLTSFKGFDGHPTWSPDGKRIAFVSDRPYINADSARYRQDLYAINTNGKGLQRLTTSGHVTNPEWSPAGDKIGFEWNIRGNKTYSYDIPSGETDQLQTGLTYTGTVKWSKDGKIILVAGREARDAKQEIRFLDMTTSPPEVTDTIAVGNIFANGEYDYYNTK